MKFKIAATLFTITVIAVSMYAVLRPSYDLGLFVDLGRTYARIRIILSLGILAYILIPFFRLKIVQLFMLFGGGILLAAGITSIFSPVSFGHLSHYTALGDIIMAFEGGTISMLAGLQLKTKEARFQKPFFITPGFYQELSALKSSGAPAQSRTAQ